MTEYRYGQRWHPRRHAPIDEIDEETARRRFVKGPWFSVSALEDGSKVPVYTLELQPQGEFVRALHYTEEGSVATFHDYARPDPDRNELFLVSAAFYVYPDRERQYGLNGAVAHVSYDWKPDGYGRVTTDDRRNPQVEVVEASDVPVTEHWVPMPRFGDWDRFARSPIAAPDPPGSDGPR